MLAQQSEKTVKRCLAKSEIKSGGLGQVQGVQTVLKSVALHAS